MKITYSHFAIILSSLCFTACTPEKVGDNALSTQEKEEGWTLLFDGQSTDGWHLYNQGKVASAWIVEDGLLNCVADTFDVVHEDLLTDEEFENYDLKFDWKISEAGNSGVFINVIERDTIPKAWASGPEYQLLDHSHAAPEYLKDTLRRAACLYNLYPQVNAVDPKPSGEWNHSEIVQKGGKVEFYLNGVLTAEQDLTTEAWKERIASSGFSYFPLFGRATKGHIALQDWSKGVSFKNIKIKEL
ncbi:DUF1080 domain-containing protein [Marinilongibacter aquaticus]|uniref:3-keto-disaccharide hydrolase n=1 Tax=Marinilongibacter aquaticus TaxID=2975157 RepID=UPI0021BD5440|nr:DUF1080 domain-containing protein [Marinilongibacter aquaticus]UBM57800.1 DUF1080 domain-containing protein [Marinilongibacter aquaticus]